MRKLRKRDAKAKLLKTGLQVAVYQLTNPLQCKESNAEKGSKRREECSVEKSGLKTVLREYVSAQVAIGQLGDHAPARGPFYEALHDKIWFIDLFQRAGILTYGRGNGRNTHRSAFKLIDNGEQDLVVYLVQAILIDV